MSASAPARAGASPGSGRGRPPTGARERILEAARAIVVEEGYGALTTQRVAAESGQNKALIQYHFGSKDGLVAAVVETIAAEILAALEHATAGSHEPAGFVSKTLERMWAFLTDNPGLQRLYFDTVAQSITDPNLREVTNRTRDAYRGILEARIAEVTAGRLAGARARAAATFFIAAFDGLALDFVERGDSPELRAARRLLVEQGAALLAPADSGA